MQRQKLAILYNNPDSLYKEIETLYELGLEDFEIQYLLHWKIKEQARLKWKNLD